MVGIDNRDYLIEQIDHFADDVVTSLDNQYNKELTEVRVEAKRKFDRKVELLKDQQEKELSKIENQHKSSFELQQQKDLLGKQGEIHAKVIKALKTFLVKGDKAKISKVYSAMAKHIESQHGEQIKNYQTPKGIKITGRTCKDTLKEPMIIGIVSKTEEYEMHVDEFLREKAVEISAIIEKELW